MNTTELVVAEGVNARTSGIIQGACIFGLVPLLLLISCYFYWTKRRHVNTHRITRVAPRDGAFGAWSVFDPHRYPPVGSPGFPHPVPTTPPPYQMHDKPPSYEDIYGGTAGLPVDAVSVDTTITRDFVRL